MINFSFSVDHKKMTKEMNRLLRRYSCYVGILDNPIKKEMISKKETVSYAGIKVLKGRNSKKKIKLCQVAEWMNKKYKWLTDPFRSPRKSAPLISVIDDIISHLNTRRNSNRILNSISAVVRNPILRKDHGHNATSTIKRKGFDHPLIATGQLYKKIKAVFVDPSMR